MRFFAVALLAGCGPKLVGSGATDPTGAVPTDGSNPAQDTGQEPDPTTPAPSDVNGTWTGTCTGKGDSPSREYQIGLDLTDVNGVVSGSGAYQVEIAGSYGYGPYDSVFTGDWDVSGQRQGTSVTLDGVETIPPNYNNNFVLVLQGDRMTGTLSPLDVDYLFLDCDLER